MNKLFVKMTASALALTTTAAYMPLAVFSKAYAEYSQTIDFEAAQIAFYAANSARLNEKNVNISGSMYSGDKTDYTGSSDIFSVSGVKSLGDQDTECELPDYIELINKAEAYDFEFDESKELFDSVLDLTESSVYTTGDLKIDHADLRGSGRLSAKGDIDISIADNSDLTQAMIMSEEGDITIDAASLDYTGIIYAPNGKVKINAKNIDIIGGIYADSIEINGTSVSVSYRNFFGLSCKAHTEDRVFLNKSETLVLSGTVSNDSAETKYSVSASQADKVTIDKADTLSPEFSFSASGEYDVTLTADLGSRHASDTIKVVVTDGPVVTYTSTEDFKAGTLSTADGSKDELRIASAKDEAASKEKKFGNGGSSGINVTAKQDKSTINSGGDKLDLSFTLEGYGQLVTGNGNDVVLCIDNSGSIAEYRPTIKAAALQIIESMGPNDRLGITSLDRLNTPLTNDKEELIAAIDKYNLGGGSDYGNGLRIVNNEIFDEESAERSKYIFLLADGENGWDYANDDEIAMEQAAIFRENGTKVYAFEINPFSYNFNDTSTVQDVAIETNGAYKLCPDADAITKFLLNIADTVYSLAARNVTFTTTVTNADWLKNGSLKKAPDSTVYNDDGSVTLSWNYNTFEIDAVDDIGLSLNTGLITDKGFVQVTRDTKLVSYDSDGEGSVVYLDDIIVGNDGYADSGKWQSEVFDSGVNNCPWSYVKWNADYYGDSAMDIYLSTSNDGVNFSGRTRVTNGQELALRGRYLRTEVEMKASGDGASPVLYDLTIYSDETESSDLRQGADSVIRGVRAVPVDAPLSLWLDIDGKYDNVTSVEWRADGGKLTGDDSLRRTAVFDKEGEYTVYAEVTAGGIKTETSVKVTVLPKTTLWQEIEQEEFRALKMSLTETPDYATQYQEPLTFNVVFDDPEKVAWVRALYKNETAWGDTYRIAEVKDDEDYLVTVPLPSHNLAETTIIVDAFDWYGNKTSEQRTIKLDRSNPSVGIKSDRSWVYPENEALITVTASDNDELAKLVLTCNEEEVPLSEENTYTFSRKQPGDYVFEATATDKAGNSSVNKYTVTVREDAGLPNVRISGSTRVILGNSTELTITAYDNETELDSLVLNVKKESAEGEPENDTQELISLNRRNGAVEKETKYTFTPESDGKYVFTAIATDREGNVNQVTHTVNAVPDTSGPSIKIELSKSEVLAGESTDVTVTVTDDVAVESYKFYVNDVEAQLTADNTYHFVSDDSNLDRNGTKYDIFKVVAVDTSGNERTATSRLRVITDDKTAPNVTISTNTRFEYKNENAYMTVIATDNISVASLEVTVNGQAVVLDSDGKYYFDTSELTEYAVTATASDAAGNQKTAERTVSVVDTTRPAITITPDKSSYGTGESPVITVEVTDNYRLDTVTATLNGEAVETGNSSFSCTIPEAAAGKYEISVAAADTSGNTQTRTYTVTVRDTVAPVITASADKERYKKSETPVVKCEYSDNVEVTRVTATMDGKNLTFDMESGQVVMPEEISEGEKKVIIKAYDAAGNASEAAEVSFYMSASDDIESPVIDEISVIPEIIRKGDEVILTVKASDDSGEVKLTVTKDGKDVPENAESGTFTFTAEETGEIKLTVRAQDPSGNYTDKEVSLTVYRNTDNRKITVDAPAVVKPAEEITVTLSSADGVPFDSTELWFGEQDLTAGLSADENGNSSITFSLDKTGSYSFKAIGKDIDGYSDETIFDIQVAGTYASEIEEPEMQEALKQTSETQLCPEIKELAQTFESPADAYEYVYNNISFEAYTNSRRGAVGAFDLKRGNDYDQASLLIGILREMGYPAKYSSADILLTSDQLTSLMAVDSFDIGQRIIASNSKKNAGIINRQDGSKLLKMEEVFVQVYVPASETGETDEALKDLGVWVSLDPSIKSSTLVYEEVTPASSETIDISSERESYAGTDLGDILDIVEPYVPALTEKTGNNTLSDFYSGPVTITRDPVYGYGRAIIQKEFNKLPTSLSYSLADENITSFNEVPVSSCDTVEFGVSNRMTGKNLGRYKISDVYNKRMTLRFEGNLGGKGNIFEMDKNSIYRNTFLPAIYVDGEIAAQYTLKDHYAEIGEFIELEDEYYFFGNDAWRLGENCTLTTRLITNGVSTTWTDELNIGSTYAMVFDVGGITSTQYNESVKAAAENNGLDISDISSPKPAEELPEASSYYDEDKIGAYLNFAGNYYFLNCDAYGSTTASLNNIELGGHTKMLMTAYRTNSLEDQITGNTLGMLPGRFLIDVSYNTGITFSRSGDTEARNDYMFNVSYMESYYEGSIWEDLLLSNGVSTVDVFNKAADEGIGFVYINSENIDTEIGKAQLESDEIADIRSSVALGYSIIVPEKRVTINKWSGTGYIIADLVGYDHFVFKLSGGTNGGSEDEDTDLYGEAMVERIVNSNVDTDRLLTGLFTGAQSMYYILLEFNIGIELSRAVATLSAASGGGIIPVFLGGMELYGAVKHLSDIIGYRVSLLEAFSDYCEAENREDEAQACVDLMNLIVEMTKDLKEILLGMLSPDDSDTIDQVKEGLKTLIKDTIGIYAEEDEDRDELVDNIIDEIIDAADSAGD